MERKYGGEEEGEGKESKDENRCLGYLDNICKYGM